MSGMSGTELELEFDLAQARAELSKREFQENPFLVIRRGLLKIKTKKGEFIPLRLRPVQQRLLDLIEKLWFEQIPIRLWILKARQEGVSTLVEAVIYVLSAFLKNINGLIISKDADQATTLFMMSKLYHGELKRKDPLLVPEIKRSNAKELVFERTRSQIRVDTARDATAGRGDNYHLVHLSEIAFWLNAGELMTGLKQTVANVPRTLIVGETTANGLGGYFYERWQEAIAGRSDWLTLFFPWFDDPTYTRPFFSEQEEIDLRQTLGTQARYNEWDGEEIELQEKHHCTLQQLNWRRSTIRNECDGDIDKFHQEYPSTPEEAFLVSGRPRFNVKILKKMLSTSLPPQHRGYLSGGSSGPEFESNPKGYLRLWATPLEGRKYVIGGDVAEGRIQVADKKESDFSCLQVLDRRTLEQVAVWHGRIDPDLFGIEAIKLARYYNDAFVGIERNNSGLTTVTRMKNENYWNVYQTTVFDEVLDREDKKLGWITSSKTKPLLIDDLARSIREYEIKINDALTLNECCTYIIEEDGKTNAQSGCFDDTVMALAIAVQMAGVYPDSVDKDLKPEDVYGTLEYWLKQKKIREGVGKSI